MTASGECRVHVKRGSEDSSVIFWSWTETETKANNLIVNSKFKKFIPSNYLWLGFCFLNVSSLSSRPILFVSSFEGSVWLKIMFRFKLGLGSTWL